MAPVEYSCFVWLRRGYPISSPSTPAPSVSPSAQPRPLSTPPSLSLLAPHGPLPRLEVGHPLHGFSLGHAAGDGFLLGGDGPTEKESPELAGALQDVFSSNVSGGEIDTCMYRQLPASFLALPPIAPIDLGQA
jgi:hypothetical protein